MRCRVRLVSLLIILSPSIGACTRSDGIFSDDNAHAHIQMLAGTIGSRPLGTDANARARAYVIDQLRFYGFEVRVQETDARRAELGRTARVANVIAVLPGSRSEAIGLVAHYDSSPHAPGGADDGVGVAAALEAARVLAGRPARTWTLLVLITDGEEHGLMGAAGLTSDRDVMGQLRAYLNLESTGSAGPAVLFETGPENGWLVSEWAKHAPHPRGGSYGFEIYKRLPNDTDFSIFKARDIPGLNFASVGDSYAYHTARDTADRVSPRVVREMGTNAIAIVTALDRADITRRTSGTPTYFDVGGTVAVSYGSIAARIVALASLVLGGLAWGRLTAFAVRGGIGRWLLTAGWSLLASALVLAAMVGATWTVRAGRQVYHPWYAHPDRLMFLLVAVGWTAGWAVSRAGAWLPAQVRAGRHPTITWTVALPVWILLAGVTFWTAPAAAYLWTVPLLTASVLLIAVPPQSELAVRIASVVVLGVAATLWLRETVDLLRFMVALFGRLAIVTPVFVYAATMAASAIMIAPPMIAAAAPARPLGRPKLVTALCLAVVAVAAGFVYAAPAYTYDSPQRRTVRALQEPGAATAVWEVASVEPGLDLGPGAPGGWTRQPDEPRTTIPWGRLPHPFVFRTAGPSLGPAPISVAGFTVQPVAQGEELAITVTPQRSGLSVSFILPTGLTPARTNLPGVLRQGRWTATFVAPPADGVMWRASFGRAGEQQLRGTRISVTDTGFPGGDGWQRLVTWLPQERAVWTASATWVVVP